MSRSGLSAVLLQRIAVLAGELRERCAEDRLLFGSWDGLFSPGICGPRGEGWS